MEEKDVKWWGKEARELKRAFDAFNKIHKDGEVEPRIIYSFVSSEDPERFIHDGAGFQIFFGEKEEIITDLEDILVMIKASKKKFYEGEI